jgi:hypothetical protein
MTIGAMDIIYQCARQLIILLEDIEIPENEERIINRYWEELMERGEYLSRWIQSYAPNEDIHILREVYKRILSARWFTRAWCCHEFRVSRHMFDDLRKQPRFRAMGTSGNIVKIPSLLLLNISFVQQDSPNADIVQYLRRLMTRSKIQTLHTLKGPNISGSWSLIQQVHDTCKLACTKINDKVQIAINFSVLPLYWKGSASSEDDVYWIFILLALAANEASVLGFEGPPLQLRHSNGVVGLSWAHRSYPTKGEGRFPLIATTSGFHR